MVNETFARELLGSAPAVGQRVHFVGGSGLVDSGGDDAAWEVIGVVADVTYRGLAAAAVSSRVLESFLHRHDVLERGGGGHAPAGGPYNRACTRRTMRCSPSW